jgi:hypothetical protein
MEYINKYFLAIIVFLFSNILSFSQVQPSKYQSGTVAEDNLNRIINASPLSTGGMGFDSRYEGVKGSPRLFEKLLPAFVRLKSQDEYFKLNIDMDVYHNSLVFSHPKTGKQLVLSSNYVNEIIITADSIQGIYKTTATMKFEKEFKDVKFCQILKDYPVQLIKMPVKVLNEADYQKVYGPDKRYDEFITSFKYYIMTSDSIFHPIQLNKKSLIKLFPEKKNIIETTETGNAKGEEMILLIISKF